MDARSVFFVTALAGTVALTACSGASSASLGPDPPSPGPTGGAPQAPANACGSPAAIAASMDHTCAIRGGALYCWGLNDHGALGTGTTASVVGAARVTGLAGVTAVGVGEAFSCALGADGGVSCWGKNDSLQLGTGASTESAVPAAVGGLRSIVAIGVGSAHACALADTGTVACWGNNADGKLGGGGSVPKSGTPVTVPDLHATAIAAGELDTVALVGGGIEWWGDNGVGASTTPSTLSGVANASAIATGNMFTCFVTAAGAARCWGYDGSGRLGDGSTNDTASPVDVKGLGVGTTVAVSTGGEHACALTTACGVTCWGKNDNGQLGDGSTTASMVPVAVQGLGSGVAAVATGFSHTCALMKTGSVKCWGAGAWLGTGGGADSAVPIDVSMP